MFFLSGGKGKDIKPVKQSLFVLLSGGKRKEVQQQKHSVTLFWLKDVKPVKQSMFFLWVEKKGKDELRLLFSLSGVFGEWSIFLLFRDVTL